MTSKPLYPSIYLSHYFLKKVLYLDQEGLLRFSSNKLPILTYSVSGLVLSARNARVTFTVPLLTIENKILKQCWTIHKIIYFPVKYRQK